MTCDITPPRLCQPLTVPHSTEVTLRLTLEARMQVADHHNIFRVGLLSPYVQSPQNTYTSENVDQNERHHLSLQEKRASETCRPGAFLPTLVELLCHPCCNPDFANHDQMQCMMSWIPVVAAIFGCVAGNETFRLSCNIFSTVIWLTGSSDF